MSVLGPLRVEGVGALRPRERVVLSVLTVRRGESVDAEQLADALWRDGPPPTWPKQVQICIGRLRKVIGPSSIETTPGGYRLALAANEIDAHRFEDLVDRGRTLAATGEPDRAATALARAVAMWHGRPFEDVDGWPPGRTEAARLEELRRSAEEDLLDARLAAGEHREVAAAAARMVAEEPLRERRWAILALAQYRCGRQADALRSLQSARHQLVEHMGIDPGSELVALELAILRHDPTLSDVPESAAASDACPYRGLAPFDVDDAETFFGREADVDACIDRMASTPLLVVSGPSGCGKSSLVRAGIVSALRQTGRPAVVVTPGTDPLAVVEEALAAVPEAPLLVVDQFEELFAFGHSVEVIREYCGRITELATRGPGVVVAVRADYLGGMAVDATISRLAEHGLHLVSPLTGDALREAIECPARQAGLRLQDGLTDLLVRDTEGEAGALPLLSHALAETWRRRDGNVMTVEGYRATGGIRGAVARSAERLYDSLSPDQRPVLRSVMMRLVAPSLDGNPVRCRVSSRTLLGDPGRERVVTMLVRSRLVTSEENTFEIAHEALARAWPRLQSWLDEDSAGQRILRHLGTAADGWDGLGRPDTELYRGARLDGALEWREAAEPDLTDLERRFLDASVEHAASESRISAEQARRDARQNRRLRTLLVATATLLVVALAAGLFALGRGRDARQQRDVARVRELAAAATANVEIDAERSILLALEAVETSRSTEGSLQRDAEEALHLAVAANRFDRRITDAGRSVDWSPDGTQVAAVRPDGFGVVLVDVRTGERVRSIDAHDDAVTGIAYGATGTVLGTTGADGAARVWNLASGQMLDEMTGLGSATGPSFSADGSTFAAAWPDDGVVQVKDLQGGGVVTEIDTVAVPESTSFDPHSQRLAVAAGSEPPSNAVVIDLETGNVEVTLGGHDHALVDISWSPDGSSIATASFDGAARVYNAETGQRLFVINGHRSHVVDVDWSPDSSRVVTASEDGSAKVWALLNGGVLEIASLSDGGTRAGVRSAAFAPDGSRVITGSADGSTTSVWDVSVAGAGEIATLPTLARFYPAATFAPDGSGLFATGPGGSVIHWQGETFARPSVITATPSPPVQPASTAPFGALPIGNDDADAIGIEVSPDGQLVAAIPIDGTIRVLDVATGGDAFTVQGIGTIDGSVAWSPDSQLLAVATGDAGAVTLVDRTGETVAVVREAEGFGVGSVEFSANGEQLVTTRYPLGGSGNGPPGVVIWDRLTGVAESLIDTTAVYATPSPDGDLVAVIVEDQSTVADVWDTRTGRQVASLDGHTGAVLDLAFSHDGSRLATTGADGTVQLWDPATGQQQLVLRGHIGLTSDVSFSPDGTRLASASADGTVRVWALQLDELVALAERELTRGLRAEECRQFLHVETCPERTQPD